MRVSTPLRNYCVRALSESMDIRTMLHMIREIFPSYDIHQRTGFPESIAIPSLDVATQIVSDVIELDKFLNFVSLLIHVQDNGLMGRRYDISYIREIIKSTYDMGFIFDTVNHLFVEDPNVRRTRNWGALEPGVEYNLAFLAIDIVGNTKLVRVYSPEVIRKTYDDLREIVSTAIQKRNGRIWNWEGDGGIVAFFFGAKHMSAAISALEIAHELYLFNCLRCPLDQPLSVRIGVHSGQCEYSDNGEDLNKLETIKETIDIEKAAKPDHVYISIVIKVMLDEILSAKFNQVGTKKNGPFAYSLRLE